MRSILRAVYEETQSSNSARRRWALERAHEHPDEFLCTLLLVQSKSPDGCNLVMICTTDGGNPQRIGDENILATVQSTTPSPSEMS
jgi:hypothetical protein